MTYEESVEQLESLIEAWKLDEADLNQTDINAMQTLLKENQESKKQLEESKDNYNCLLKQKEQFEYIMSKQVDYQGQQKEFIEYMTKTIEELECDDVDDEEMKGYLIQRIDTFKEILLKFKEIIGDINDKK